MHAALHALGIECNLDELTIVENLSGEFGSTAADLIRIAEEHGAAAEYRPHMTYADLRASSTPLILHTTAAVTKSGFHHWMLFLGMDGNSVRLYDPPRGMYAALPAEVMNCWDGIGICVHTVEDSPEDRAWNLELFLAFLLVVLATGLVQRFSVFRGWPVLALLTTTVSSAAVWHVIVDYGLLTDRSGAATVAARYEQFRIPTIELSEFRRMIDQGDLAIIDARLPRDYQRSHVEKAVSLPITCTLGDVREKLAAIPKSNRIVVYCQSTNCRWSDAIAQQTAARGYDQVYVYRDGMEGWAAAHNPRDVGNSGD